MKTLSYQRVEPPLGPGAHLLEDDDGVTLVEVLPGWLQYLVLVVATSLAGVGAAFIVHEAPHLPPTVGRDPEMIWLVGMSLMVLFCWCWAVCAAMHVWRRPGRLRVELVISAGGLQRRDAGLLYGYWRRDWPCERICDHKVRPLAPLLGKSRSQLIVRIKGRLRPLIMQFTYTDATFPERVEAALRRVLRLGEEDSDGW